MSAVKRAFNQFLALPVLTVLAFMALNAVTYLADDAWSQGHVPDGFGWLGRLLGDNQALNGLLTTAATSIITITSITFSLLLLAVQQGASALTAQVTDQFMLRRSNQFYFGFFVGLSIFALATLITNSPFHRPVFGTSLTLVLTAVALCLVVLMIYSTIDQMRPVQIVRFIHGKVLGARAFERRLLGRTKRAPTLPQTLGGPVRARASGYLVGLDIETVEDVHRRLCPGGSEIEVVCPLGRYLALGDPVFALRGGAGTRIDGTAEARISEALLAAIALDDGRDLGCDASYGLSQLATIGWTSVSTAKSNPSPGLLVIESLRDILARWIAEEAEGFEDAASAVIYADTTLHEAADALETLIVVASESMQPQTLSAALATVSILLPQAPPPLSGRLADIALRALSSLGEHVATKQLTDALSDLAVALKTAGHDEAGKAVEHGAATLGRSVGKLNSRSTRVPPAGA